MEALTDEAAKGLALEGDKYVAEIISAAASADEITVVDEHGGTIDADNAMEVVENCFTKLYENDCKVSDTFYLELMPKAFTTYRQALTELSTNNPEILKKGAVGKINNAYVCIDNCLPDNLNVLRTDKAIAFAEQIEKVEKYRPEDAFTDAVKGLYVFGAKIVRPKEIVVFPMS
jgi:hypothetical protein